MQTSGKTGVLALFISAITSIAVAVIAAWPSAQSTRNDQLLACQKLEERHRIELRELRTSAEPEIRELLREFLNGQGVEAWVKRYDEDLDEYIMWVISDAYAKTFRLRLDNYELESDGDVVVWHPNIAKIFRQHDDEALYTHGCITPLEPIGPPFNKWMPVRKCYFRFNGDDYVSGFLLHRWPAWAGEEPEKAFQTFHAEDLNIKANQELRGAR